MMNTISNVFDDDVTRTWLKDVLRDSIVEVAFTKKDGTERKMKCTLKPSLLPVQEEKEQPSTRKVPTDSLAVYDLENNGWRSFRYDSITTISFELFSDIEAQQNG